MFARLREPDVAPYDLAVFDEAHKLSARLDTDFTFRRTDRYRVAEALGRRSQRRPGVSPGLEPAAICCS